MIITLCPHGRFDALNCNECRADRGEEPSSRFVATAPEQVGDDLIQDANEKGAGA